MKRNDWSTRKIYGSDGKLIKMEHSYNFLNNSTNNHNYLSPVSSKASASTYVYYNSDSPDSALPEERSFYASDMEFPLPWKEPIGACLEDSDEERKIKAEWFSYVKKRRLGKNWRDENKKIVNTDTHPSVTIHNAKLYQEWVKRKALIKPAFTYKYFSEIEWKKNKDTINIKSETPCIIDTVPKSEGNNYYNEPVAECIPKNYSPMPKVPVVASPTEDKVLQEKNNNVPKLKCDLTVPNSQSPNKKEQNYKKFNFDIDSIPLGPRKTIFKHPATGFVKQFKNENEALISAEWEGKKIDIMFFKWSFLPKDREKLTFKDSLQAFLRIGQSVGFHGARTIPGTDFYETNLVYEGNNYPTLAMRSGYNLKKWFVEKDIYTFPRIATVKSTILPYHASIEIEKPSRNSDRHVAAIMIEDLYINKDDASHAEGWIDDFIKPGDKIFVELHYLKENSAGVKRAWKSPPEEIIKPRKNFIPRKLPANKFVFSCRDGKSYNGTVRDVEPKKGIFLTSIKDRVFEIHFNQFFIDGFEVGLNLLITGDEICFSQFRLENGGEHWCPRIWKGHPPSINSLVEKYDERNRNSVVNLDCVYAGRVVEFILPSHAILKVKGKNDLDIFVLLSKLEICPKISNQVWIDRVLKIDDVLTFKIKKLSDVRYSAVQVYSSYS